MKKALALIVALAFILHSFSQGNYEIENAQEHLATRVVDEIEKNNFEKIYQFIDSAYLKNQQSKIKSILAKFYTDYKTLSAGTTRGVTLVWPTGINLFRFRYFDTTGTVLQIDISFKKNDIHSKIVLLETIERMTFKKQRENSKPGVVYVGKPPKQKYPYTTMFQLKNCQKENRIVTFSGQVSFFMWWVYGKVKLEENKVVQFSKDYVIDSNFLRQNIEKVKKSLPGNFWTLPMGKTQYENVPDEPAIWFIDIYAQVDKAGNIKIFSAYKITFEGTDATIVTQRSNPKVKNIEFITDKTGIQALEKKLKVSPATVY